MTDTNNSHLDPLLEEEPIDDIDLLLLSWAQMAAIEMIVADEEAMEAKTDLVALLMTDYDVTDITLIERTYEHYEISFRQGGEVKTVRFDTSEVESIYDL
ncbi:hypothetical protein CIG75_02460 [Tumebacillus algifaecis]|uniref:Halobacterial output domain-containing protein n=1 Tax=Tumebacillus algifaecis TaxID=1214604 RepID=A0A223CXN8_9BACL|nr:hypothetical protein [Tumebacillus algifaecis]ASS73954.1 hypothetical protein CIG75_02460 [Tumebacillus algifaecis]